MRGRRFAYADPPYLGCAQRYYGDKHPEAARFDTLEAHAELVRDLERDYPDGWALSCHVPSLARILSVCPEGVRVAAWVKPFSGVRPRVRARFGWEPVIYRTSLAWDDGPQFTDWLMADGNRSRKGVELFPGKKPVEFAVWLCRVLGARPGDEVVDLFPGSGTCSGVFARVPQLDPEQFRLELVA